MKPLTTTLAKAIATLLFALAALIASAVPAAAADSINGRWITQDKDAVIVIGRCGAVTCGKISEILVPPPDGDAQRDIYNPDPKLRVRKLLGLPILTNFNEETTLWRGRIYDPSTGKSYRSVIRRRNATTLEVKGCIGPFCQTQIWRKAS